MKILTKLCKESIATKFSSCEPDRIQLNSEVLLEPWLSILLYFFPLAIICFLTICLLYDQMKRCYKRESGWNL